MYTEQEHWSTLRELLNGSPCTQRWEDLLRALRKSPSEDTWSIDLDYVISHLESWDDSIRFGSLAEYWSSSPFGKPEDLWHLVRATHFDALIEEKELNEHHELFLSQLQHIRRLSLANLAFSTVEYWFQSNSLPQLTSLSLRACGGFEKKLGTEPHADLEKLDARWAECFENMAPMPALTELHMESITIGLNTIKALQKSGWISQIKKLSLSHCQLYEGSILCLGELPFTSLEELDLSNNEFGDRGIELLLRSPYLKQLNSIKLNGNRITSNGAKKLADAVHWAKIKHFEIRDNLIDHEGFRAFATAQNMGIRNVYMKTIKFLSG